MINTVKSLRETHNFTQSDLGYKIGVSRKTIISIENGKTKPSIDVAYKISTLFKLPVEKVFINENLLVHKKESINELHFIDLFCGIGGFRFAIEKVLKNKKISFKCVFSSDIDEFAKISYNANFGEEPFGDITKIESKDIPDHDILFAGFPCQPFSIAGLGKGFNDIRGTLFFEIARIISEKRPKAFVLENVKRLVSHDSGRTLQKILYTLRNLGYYAEYKVLNALDCGLPQKRERVIIVGSRIPFNMKWPKKRTDGKTLLDVLEKNIPQKYYASEMIVNKRMNAHKSKYYPSIWHENKNGNISSYPYSCALRAGASYNYLLVNGKRRLTPKEMLRLQGFPDNFKIIVNDSQIRKQAGNAIPVNMIEAVLEDFVPLIFGK